MGDFTERRQNKRQPHKKIAILYHKNCSDGFGAAWAAWKKFGENAEYIAVAHDNSSPPAHLKGKEVYLLDFCYPRKDMEHLLRTAKSLTIIDHHATVKDVVLDIPNHVFAVSHSGAVLAWKYFHPGKSVPMLLRYVEEVDLWHFTLPDVWVIRASLYNMYPFKFKIWDMLAKDFEYAKTRKKYKEEGMIISAYEQKIIDRLVEKADMVEFEGYKTLAINSPILNSELGAALSEKMPPMGIVYAERGGRLLVSLRGTSKSKKKVDCGKIAKKYGGGGHPFAAAFVLSAKKHLPWQILKKAVV